MSASKSILAIAVLNLLFTFKIYAQIIGTVVSAADKHPIPAVTIRFVKAQSSNISNEDGAFRLNIPTDINAPDSIIFSSIGYQTRKISLNDALKDKSLIVMLTQRTEELQEVVVRPLSLTQMLDSLRRHNLSVFVSPGQLNGYYREFVITNAKCTAYSDALFRYNIYQNNKPGELNIEASRCEKATENNTDRHAYETYMGSKLNPDQLLRYAMLTDMIDNYFPKDHLQEYDYSMQSADDNGLKIIVYPKPNSTRFYRLTFYLSDDFTLKQYQLEIPEAGLKLIKEKSLLGIHSKLTGLTLTVKYFNAGRRIYPGYLNMSKSTHLFGKMLGVSMDQTTEQKSEFVVTAINSDQVIPFNKKEIYKKGNICDNGTAMNADMLRKYNFIQPTKKDSLAINSISSLSAEH